MSRRALPDLGSLLASSPSETTPVLLALAREQAARRSPAQLLEQWGRDAFVHPSPLDLRLAHRLDGLALEAASEFEALLLAPVAPLGTCSAVALTSQDRTLSAARGLEVVSDPTNVLALECARRLRASATAHPKLTTVHQVLRGQPLPPGKGFTRHFRLFVLAEAGLGKPDDGFEVEAVVRHIATYDRFMNSCTEQLRRSFPNRSATILSTPERGTLAKRAKDALAAALPHLTLREGALDKAYYDGVRVMFGADTATGEHCPIADLGLFDWLPALAAQSRARYVASGFGLQLVSLVFAET